MAGILEVMDTNVVAEAKLCYVCWENFTPGPKPKLPDPELLFYNVCPGCKAKHPDRNELIQVRINSMRRRREYLRSLPGEEGRFHRMIANQPRSMPAGDLFRMNYKADDGS